MITKIELYKESLLNPRNQNRINMKHIYQPNGYTCGPTCIKMVLNPNKHETIEEIANLCTTDDKVGSPPEKMEKGMNALGVDYTIKSGFENLKQSIVNSKPCLIRTIITGIPHWIIVYGIDEAKDTYYINDPWLGQRTLSGIEVDKIWKPRYYFYYEINDYTNE